MATEADVPIQVIHSNDHLKGASKGIRGSHSSAVRGRRLQTQSHPKVGGKGSTKASSLATTSLRSGKGGHTRREGGTRDREVSQNEL